MLLLILYVVKYNFIVVILFKKLIIVREKNYYIQIKIIYMIYSMLRLKGDQT